MRNRFVGCPWIDYYKLSTCHNWGEEVGGGGVGRTGIQLKKMTQAVCVIFLIKLRWPKNKSLGIQMFSKRWLE